jgi:hypothetical protein
VLQCWHLISLCHFSHVVVRRVVGERQGGPLRVQANPHRVLLP